jgi:hypothetical protein
VVAAVVGIAAVLAVRSFAGGGGGDGGGTAAPERDDTGCVVVQLAASSEKAALLRDLAAEYADDGAEVDGTCARVEVTSKASGGAMEALGPRLGRAGRRPAARRLVAGVVVVDRAAARADDGARRARPRRRGRAALDRPDAAGDRHAAADGRDAGLAGRPARLERRPRAGPRPAGLGRLRQAVGGVPARQDPPRLLHLRG